MMAGGPRRAGDASRKSRLLILLYHRVAYAPCDPWSLAVTPEHFATQLAIISRLCRPLALTDALRALQEGRLPRRAVVTTFDDGYADNLHTAVPLLERYGVPATMFITTKGTRGDREFWWDELGRILLSPGELPEELTLRVGGRSRAWQLGEAAHYSEADCYRHRGWRAGEAPPTARHALHDELWHALHTLPVKEHQELMDELMRWAGCDSRARSTHGLLNACDIKILGQMPLVEIGAHTVNHPSLARLPRAAQREELGRAKEELQRLTGRAVHGFAYPYGKPHDYTPETMALVREAEFTHACLNVPGTVDAATPPLQLLRMYVRDWSYGEFFKRLWRWLQA